jgi:hypothetical protein
MFVKLESQYTTTPMAFKVPTLDMVVLVWIADIATETMTPDRNATSVSVRKTTVLLVGLPGENVRREVLFLGGST